VSVKHGPSSSKNASAKRSGPRTKKRVKEEVLQAELETGLDDLVTESIPKTSGRKDAKGEGRFA
jgi:hypothetical protein